MRPVPALLLAVLAVSALAVAEAHGHGSRTETFPPVQLHGRPVTLEVSSSDGEDGGQLISVSLIDLGTGVTLRDVTFLVVAERGETPLFEGEFDADHGFLVFSFESADGPVLVEEAGGGGLFGPLLGLESRKIHVRGPGLGDGGLYKLEVHVLAADGYSNPPVGPLFFNAGISVPQAIPQTVEDPNYGVQEVALLTYYDTVHGFEYEPATRQISYSMPFEWSLYNVEKSSVVHQEISIPDTFGDLLVSGFEISVNGAELAPDVANIDDFFAGHRLVHFNIYQNELLKLLEAGQERDVMDFVVRPDRDPPHYSAVTENAQFRILASWEPEDPSAGSEVTVSFDVTDVFLKNRPVSAGYDFVVTQGADVLHRSSGTSTDARGEHNYETFTVPAGVTGIIRLGFENLDGNGLASASMPMVVDRAGAVPAPVVLPGWMRDTALWWSQGELDDATFITGIEYLIEGGIIEVRASGPDGGAGAIPAWVRETAGWWADGTIDDGTFAGALEFLVREGVIGA